ncbi:MAG: hypothetical protein ACREAA_21140 [Candidatus Polarisedimenticolia bacterium]
MMNVLNFLKNSSSRPVELGLPISEYRLLCSGLVYNSEVFSVVWTQNRAARCLSERPFELSVLGDEEYPQELILRIAAGMTSESGNGISIHRQADDEIAEDLAALLSLLLRRLITVSAKVRISLPGEKPEEFPMPLLNSIRRTVRRKRPSFVKLGSEGLSVSSHVLPPVPVHAGELHRLLSALPHLESAAAYVRSARLYSQAVRLLDEYPDVSYVLLISCVETAADAYLPSWKPDSDKMRESKKSMIQYAEGIGLREEQWGKLADLACKDMRWTSERFQEFLIRYVPDSLWEDSEEFKSIEAFIPSKERFCEVLKLICRTRGRALHAGEAFPITGRLEPSEMLPVDAVLHLSPERPCLPPATWFERVVSMTLRSYLESRAPNELATNRADGISGPSA